MAEAKKQPTYMRQRFLLAFIRQLNESVSATDLQKLVFINKMSSNSDFYEFIPYKYGPYSFQLAEDVEILRRDGFLTTETLRIQAVGGVKGVSSLMIADERGSDLIRKAYRAYPYYAMNSEVLDRLFNPEEAVQLRHSRDAYINTEQVLFTIGYEGRGIETFINTLIQNDVRVLVDVRKNPLSRKFGFSKGKLKQISETVRIKYIHVPDLGIESEKRSALETTLDYYSLFEAYEKALPDYTQQIEALNMLLCKNARIALMCFEKNSEMCHRHVIRDYMTKEYQIRSIDL